MPTTSLKNPVNVNVSTSSVCLEVSGTQAAPTTLIGAAAPAVLTVTGPAGQNTTGSTGQTAGIGAAVDIIAGPGGAAPSGSTNGRGGSVVINPGAPGAGGGTAATYGNILMATAGGQVAIGGTVPTASLDITGTLARVISGTRIGNAAASATFAVRKANTNVTPVANGHEIGNFVFSGYDGVSYVPGGRIRAVVDGPVSTGSVPIGMAFSTGGGTLGSEEGPFGNPNATVEQLRITSGGNIGLGIEVPTSKLHVNGGVQVGVPTDGDMGTGSINVAADIYKNGTAFTNPDYVFEHHFNGSTQAAYAGPIPLAQLEEAIKTHGQLPGVGREPMGVFGRQDALLEKLEEAYLYIIELTKRLDRLEARMERPAGKETA